MIVDDSRVMRRIISRMVGSLGFSCVEAGDGQAAIDLIESSLVEQVPDVVLTDWHMPGCDGLELVRRLRGDPRLDGLRIVVITSESEIDRVEEALAAGADEYLMKPFDEAALEAKLSMLGLAY